MDSQSGVKFVTGIAIGLLTTRLYNHLQIGLQSQEDEQNQTLEETEDLIRIEELAELTKSESANIRSAALQIVFDRAMSDTHLNYIISGLQQKDLERRRKSLIAIQAFAANNPKNSSLLIKKRVLKLIVRALHYPSTEELDQQSITALYYLVLDNDKRKRKICEYHIIERITEFLLREPYRFSGLKDICIQLIHQLCSNEASIKYMVEGEVVFTLFEMLKLTYGNLEMQKTCVYSMVRILSSMGDDTCQTVLVRLAEMNVVSIASACLRRNHHELTCWTIWLLHQFVMRNIQVENISKIKGLVPLLLQSVKPGETITSTSVLRMFRSICDYKSAFYKDLLKAKIMPLLVKCLSGSDDQTQYSALSLIHAITYKMHSHAQFFEHNGMDAVLGVGASKYYQNHLYMVEIIVNEALNIPKMEKRLSILDHLIRFSEDENFELKQSSISVITNLVTVSSVFRKYALELNIVQKYSKMLNRSTTESSKPNVAKLLVCLVDCDVGTRYQVFMEAIVPLLQNLVGDMNACVKESGIMDEEIVISTKDNPEKKMAMSPVRKEFDSVVVERVAESPQGPTDTSFPDIASPVTVKPLKELALTWKLSMDALAILFDSDLLSLGTSQENHDYIELFQDYCAYLFSTIMNAFLFAISQKELSDAYGFEVANTATKLLANFVESMQVVELFEILVKLFETRDDTVIRHVITLFYLLTMNGIGRNEIIEQPDIFLSIYKAMAENRDEDMWPYFHGFVSGCSDWTTDHEPVPFVNLDNEMTSPQIDVFPDTLEIYNRSWNFESVVGSHGVTLSGKYAFEFQLGTVGIIQLGWCSDQSKFNRRGGYGVGDDQESYALDGTRRRKWHGRDVEEETYGTFWSRQDVVTCLLDLDEKTISFCLNGKDLGVAFRDVDVSKVWYPAISLTSDQYGVFKFGGPLDKLLFCPAEYSPISVEKELFYSCISLQTIESATNFGQASLNTTPDDYDKTPTLLTMMEREPISSISMFFEITVQINSDSTKVIQAGYVTKSKVFVFAAYHSLSNQLFFMSSDHDGYDGLFFDTYLQQVLHQEQFGMIPWTNEDKDLKIYGRARCDLTNGSVIGMGINEEEGFCFFSHNGIIIGPKITMLEFEVVPYLRNIPRYICNFGKHDYVTQDANTCFSPSVFVVMK